MKWIVQCLPCKNTFEMNFPDFDLYVHVVKERLGKYTCDKCNSSDSLKVIDVVDMPSSKKYEQIVKRIREILEEN